MGRRRRPQRTSRRRTSRLGLSQRDSSGIASLEPQRCHAALREAVGARPIVIKNSSPQQSPHAGCGTVPGVQAKVLLSVVLSRVEAGKLTRQQSPSASSSSMTSKWSPGLRPVGSPLRMPQPHRAGAKLLWLIHHPEHGVESTYVPKREWSRRVRVLCR